jgi:hypothetical protein
MNKGKARDEELGDENSFFMYSAMPALEETKNWETAGTLTTKAETVQRRSGLSVIAGYSVVDTPRPTSRSGGLWYPNMATRSLPLGFCRGSETTTRGRRSRKRMETTILTRRFVGFTDGGAGGGQPGKGVAGGGRLEGRIPLRWPSRSRARPPCWPPPRRAWPRTRRLPPHLPLQKREVGAVRCERRRKILGPKLLFVCGLLNRRFRNRRRSQCL